MTELPEISAEGAIGQVPAIEVRGIRKRFADVVAVDGVDLSFRPGEVHAVLGENGAGKSTLMNIVSGFLAPDAGTIAINGEPVVFKTPRDALDAHIGMVHQHFRLVEQFTVAENLALGAHFTGRASRADLTAHAEELAQRFNFAVDPSKPLWQLSEGEKQRVEILRTLAQGALALVLDEPTSVLTEQESEFLLKTMRAMAGEGAAVIFVSHKLNEVLAVADRITVMRKGAVVASMERSEADLGSLANLMIGDSRTQADVQVHGPGRVPVGGERLGVKGVDVYDDRGVHALKNVSLSVNGGEIVGVAGVAGNGQKELEEVLTGLRRPAAGVIEVDGRDLAGRPVRQFIEAGVAHIPEDRRGTALAIEQPIWCNAILKAYRRDPISSGPFLRRGRAVAFASRLAEEVNLSTRNVNTLAGHLSGGNAQKLVAGRELSGERSCLVAVNPSQGLDVGAVAFMWEQMVAARDGGLGVLLISADLDEVMYLSDRVLVIYDGEVVGEFTREDSNRQEIGLRMGGGVTAGV